MYHSLPGKRRPAEKGSQQIVTSQQRQNTNSQERQRDVLSDERLSVNVSSLFTKLDGFSGNESEDGADDDSEGDFVSVNRGSARSPKSMG